MTKDWEDIYISFPDGNVKGKFGQHMYVLSIGQMNGLVARAKKEAEEEEVDMAISFPEELRGGMIVQDLKTKKKYKLTPVDND